MKIVEIFSSIQGEGPNVGKPSIFVRLHGCNIKCDFCDSKFSWDESNNYTNFTVEQVVNMVKKFNINHIVITGGEPMLQKEEIIDFINQLEDSHLENIFKYKFELETNGSMFDLDLNMCLNYISVSPKGTFDKRYIKDSNAIFKYVCNNAIDFGRMMKEIRVWRIDKTRVYVMPQCTNRQELIDQSEWLIPLCINVGVNYCPRVHLMLWDGERGV